MHSTSEKFDAEGVRDFVARYGLDPVPSRKARVITLDEVRLTVETYNWGRIFFAEYRSANKGATWIERGEHRIASLPSWTNEIRARVDRPGCLGHRAVDPVCDGGLDEGTGIREPACRWRAACMHVQRLAGKPAVVPMVLEQHTDEELWAAAGPKRKVVRPQRAVPVRMGSAKTKSGGPALVQEIVERVAEKGGWELQEKAWRAGIWDLYVMERPRVDRSTMFDLMRKRPIDMEGDDARLTDQFITRFIPRTSDGRVVVQIMTADLELCRHMAPMLMWSQTGESLKNRQEASVGVYCSARGVDDDSVEAIASTITVVLQQNRLTTLAKGVIEISAIIAKQKRALMGLSEDAEITKEDREMLFEQWKLKADLRGDLESTVAEMGDE